MSSSSSPQHPAFFHSPSPFFYSLFFIISVSPILFPDFRLSPSPFSLPQPLHFDYLSESPSSGLFFSLLPFPVLSLCPTPLRVSLSSCFIPLPSSLPFLLLSISPPSLLHLISVRFPNNFFHPCCLHRTRG